MIIIFQKPQGRGDIMSDRFDNFVKGLVIGGAIGALVGILFAPKSGKETREDIAQIAEEVKVKTKKEYELALEKSKKAYEAATIRLKQFESTQNEKVAGVLGKVKGLAEKGNEVDSKSNKLSGVNIISHHNT
jgi:gas vesicle protein